MDTLEVTWSRATRVWWSFMWRATLFSALAAGVLVFVSGTILVALGRVDLVDPLGRLLSYGVTIPISIAVLRQVLRKEFADFEIRLVPRIPL